MKSSEFISEEIMPDKKTHLPDELARIHNVPITQIYTQLRMGLKVESEHTKNHELAMEIALDHLLEFPDYYTRLAQANL